MDEINQEQENKRYQYEAQAVRDAQRLVAYTAKKGKDIDDETLITLTISEEKLRSNQWTPEFAVKFWKAIGKISQIIYPATVDSVRSICTEQKYPGIRGVLANITGRSSARRTTNTFTILTLFIMLILLIFQVYWVVGNTLEVKLTELLNNEVDLTTEINIFKHDLSELELLYKVKEMETMNIQAYSSDYAFSFYSTPEWEREKLLVELNITRVDKELEAIRSQLERNYYVLLRWSSPWSKLLITSGQLVDPESGSDELGSKIKHLDDQIAELEGIITDDQDAGDVIVSKQRQLADFELELANLGDSENLELESEIQTIIDKLKKELANPEDLKQQNITQRNTTLQDYIEEKNDLERQLTRELVKAQSRRARLGAGFVLVILESYILPVLYGLLGASAYVLRSTAHEIEEGTYTAESNGSYILRLALGTLAGLMVGWFVFLFPSRTFLSSISPLAIAFLVGYNIEILFYWMDEFIKRFGTPGKPTSDEPMLETQTDSETSDEQKKE